MIKVSHSALLPDFFKVKTISVFFFPLKMEAATLSNPPEVFTNHDFLVAIWKIKWKNQNQNHDTNN